MQIKINFNEIPEVADFSNIEYPKDDMNIYNEYSDYLDALESYWKAEKVIAEKYAINVFANKLQLEVINLPAFEVEIEDDNVYITFN
jgi:hypothetical protein